MVAFNALVDPQNNISRIASTDVVDPSVAVRPGWRWLPVEDTQPLPTPAQPILEGPVVTVLANKVTRVWTIRARTAADIDAYKEALMGDTANGPQWRVLFNLNNRTRALEGQPLFTTLAQFRAYVKALIPDPS